jgi:hypothetical protein
MRRSASTIAYKPIAPRLGASFALVKAAVERADPVGVRTVTAAGRPNHHEISSRRSRS